MPKLDELDDAALAKAQKQRKARISALVKAGYERWDMTPEGDERYLAVKHGHEIIKTVQYDPDTASYRIV